MTAAMVGFLCRVVGYASTVAFALNSVTVEFSTPYVAAPDGVVFCFESPTMRLDEDNATVLELIEGGTIDSTAGERSLLRDDGDPVSDFESRFDYPLLALTNLRDLLANDEFFAHSYFEERLDEFRYDGYGPPERPYHALLSQGFTSSKISRRSLVQSGPGGNCVLLSGEFARHTRYSVTFNFSNPSAGSDLRLWSAPLTYTKLQDKSIAHAIRGPKYGLLCEQPSWVDNEVSEAAPPPLQPLSDTPAIRSTTPSSSLSYNSSTYVPPSGSCTGFWRDSPRYPECVLCPSTTSCECDGYYTNLVGTKVCETPYDASGFGSDTIESVAEDLCDFYVEVMSDIQYGYRSDNAFPHLEPFIFMRYARALVDEYAVRKANKTLFEEYLLDGRRPDFPTRKSGIEPNCIPCEDGMYEDALTGEMKPILDNRFKTLSRLRLIGLLLDTAADGVSCSDLLNTKTGEGAGTEKGNGPYVGVERNHRFWPASNADNSELIPGDTN